jgi:hypothetical protein
VASPALAPKRIKSGRSSAGRAQTRDVTRAMFTCYTFLPLPADFEDFSRVLKVPGV